MESDRRRPNGELTEFQVVLEFPNTAEGWERHAKHLKWLMLKHKLNKLRASCAGMIVDFVEADVPFVVKAED